MKKRLSIKIVAPGSFSAEAEYQKGAAEIKKWGMNVSTDIQFEKSIPFHSADDQRRFDSLKNALHSDADVIWCLRGGYGAIRLLNDLSKIKKPKKEKIFIGFSDITSLNLFFAKKWEWKCVHGPMISSFSNENFRKKDLLEVKKYLTDQKNFSSKIPLRPFNQFAKKINLKGELVGGNLSVIQTSLGTKYSINTKNKILFLEDIGERGYKLDRMFYHLEQALVFKDVKAIILGDFSGGNEVSGENFVNFALTRFANNLSLPIFTTDEFGHGLKNRMLVFNHIYHINDNKLVY